MMSRNSMSWSGDSVLLPGRVPEGRLLSCILKEMFSQNKPAQSVIKAPRWQSCPFMCFPTQGPSLPLKAVQSSPSPSRPNNSTKVVYQTEVPGLMGCDVASKWMNTIKFSQTRQNVRFLHWVWLSSFVPCIHFEEVNAGLMWKGAKHYYGHVLLRTCTTSPPWLERFWPGAS